MSKEACVCACVCVLVECLFVWYGYAGFPRGDHYSVFWLCKLFLHVIKKDRCR